MLFLVECPEDWIYLFCVLISFVFLHGVPLSPPEYIFPGVNQLGEHLPEQGVSHLPLIHHTPRGAFETQTILKFASQPKTISQN